MGKYQKNKSRFPLQNVDNPRTAKGLETLHLLGRLPNACFRGYDWGSPWVHCSGWAFDCPTMGEIAPNPCAYWHPLTHVPSYRVLDGEFNTSCPYSLATVMQIRPIVHVFGHMHEGQGILHTEETMFINGPAIISTRKSAYCLWFPQ